MDKEIWHEFNVKNIGDYHDHYLKKDFLLFADVFEKFIDTCLKFYGLDPRHYFSSPGLSRDGMLKITGVRLEKIVGIDMYLFIEKGLRGGISYIAKRLAKANNKYMKNYDPKSSSKYILYLDMNNLYGWTMNGYLPYGEVEKRYIIEAGPDELNVLHNDYPSLAPEKLAIPYDMLPDYWEKNADKYEIKVGDMMKLIPNLINKTNYVLYYRNVQLYLSLGIKLTKVHRES